ncbi:MAG TPA: hypothetical protein VGY99_23105 [Candidatus Binataceae bacterium]|jgi:hypothetical protein|nr:hypothetical protein [Candidatus Binataceae bacterium]
MKKFLTLVFVILGLVAAIGQAQSATPTATPIRTPAPTPVPNVWLYSVKFLCGLQSVQSNQFKPPAEPQVKPGNYATSINVHNFHSSSACLAKKAAIAGPESADITGQVSAFRGFKLGPDDAFEIDCSDIVSLFPAGVGLPPFIEGFVEIQSRSQLNVTAVYTTQTCNTSPTAGGCTSLGQLGISVVPESYFIAPKTSAVCP